MEERNTPPYPCLNNPKHDISKPPDWSFGIATPTSISFTSPQVAEADRTTMSLILKSPTQALVDCNQQLKRVQQDLLVLNSFNDNSTLHWRPCVIHQELGPLATRVRHVRYTARFPVRAAG